MLPKSLRESVERAIHKATGVASAIGRADAVGGGCIHHACRIDLTDGRCYFLKWNASPLPSVFDCEAEGLRALREADTLRVPTPLCTGSDLAPQTPPFIVMEYIRPGRVGPRFFDDLGYQLAETHRRTQSDQFGFARDNYLGSTPQPNTWNPDWVEFWRRNRLGYQLQLARRNGLSDSAFDRAGERLLARLDEHIAEPVEPPCLLHGDLWSGNYLADEVGNPVVIDPAVYYGRREADLAMTVLFGGFSPRFYAAYEETWALEEDWESRLDIYKLYHLLNHLNLFGGSYREACMSILLRYSGG